MAHTRAWSTTKADPVDTDLASGLGDDIRTQAVDIEERMVIDHDWDSQATGGEHTALHLQEQALAPTIAADYGGLYVAEGGVSVKGELFYKDEDANVVQLTGSGKIMLGSGILANNAPLQGEDSGGTAQNLLLITAGDEIELSDVSYPTRIYTDAVSSLVVEYGSGDQAIWHAGNHGAASGLDADTVDTYEGTDLMLSADATVAGRYYQSASTALGALNTTTNFAHGLGAVPRLYQVALICIAGELGYAIDDEVIISANGAFIGEFGSHGIQCYANATNVGIVMGSGRTLDVMKRVPNNTWTGIDESKWETIVRAWR